MLFSDTLSWRVSQHTRTLIKPAGPLVSSVPHNRSFSQPLIAEITLDQAGLIFGADGLGRSSESQVFIVDGCGAGADTKWSAR